jgi:hypothetical protein
VARERQVVKEDWARRRREKARLENQDRVV